MFLEVRAEPMGMFDNVQCKYPLPWPESADFGFEWQSKSAGCELHNYEIREDGTLWHEDCDYEDRSDQNAEGIMRLRGMMTPVNKRWVKLPWEGEFEIHHLVKDDVRQDWWYECRFWFCDGVVKDVITFKRKSGLDCEVTSYPPEAREVPVRAQGDDWD